ncbi:type II/IV secretion system ATPase subunit [Sulfuracidifex tepidarius]|uniref:AAA+ ATPase domain-containing protein n=1 Tax=Sulfuracidifex tepidarius TaxID=1294262 RepID=A0A510E0A7_9CREN|nr:type II/IV secretion system ATPase subunit [Sulfuracidifex tepidarius]BBG25867.1 hypothetical protein IC007_0372 [Sulfuracidifex tepidarius]
MMKEIFFKNNSANRKSLGSSTEVVPTETTVSEFLEVKGKVLKEYTLKDVDPILSLVNVTVVSSGGKGYYLISEPSMSPDDVKVVGTIVDYVYSSMPTIEEDRGTFFSQKRKIMDYVKEVEEEMELVDNSLDVSKVTYFVLREMSYSGISPMIFDPLVEEIEVTSSEKPVTVVHRDFTEFFRLETNVRFSSERDLMRFVEKISDFGGRDVSIANPMQDFILKEGHRVAVTYGNEVSLPGTTLDIRKHPEEPFTIVDLLRFGTITIPEAVYMWIIAEARKFMLIVGPTGSGKTTLLNSVLMLLNPNAKFLTIEDTPELKLSNEVWVRLFTRTLNFDTGKEIDMADLVKLSLRYRPDYIIVGEIRGSEMGYLVQAVSTGHGGLTTFHGGNVEDMKTRIVSLLSDTVSKEFKNLLSSVVVIKNTTDYLSKKQVRKVTGIWESVGEGFEQIMSYESGGVSLSPQLKDAMNLMGWDENILWKEVKRRGELLSFMVKRNMSSYHEISSTLSEFYLYPEAMERRMEA